MSVAIDVSHVSKSFRRYRADRPHTFQEVLARGWTGLRATERFWALRDVSFSVPRGRAVGIIGMNGSGKSTLLRLVGGIGTADSGRVTVAGRIGALLDLGSGFHQDLTGRENVMVAGVLAGLSRRDVLRRFDEIVAFSEIDKFIDNPIRTYSSGMRMRLAFATNVHTDPDVLLIDEVLAVGDAAFQSKCVDRIKAFKGNGCSILLVSHGLAVMQTLCDEALWMHGGRLTAHGPVSEVVERYEAHIGHTMELELAETAPPRVAAAPSVDGQGVGDIQTVTDVPEPSRPRINSVALLDDAGQPVDQLRPGHALRVAIDVEANRNGPLSCVRVKVVRDDGLVCCNLSSEQLGRPGAGETSHRITLVLERLDLSPGRYGVDVTPCTADRTPAAVQGSGCTFDVVGDGDRAAVLSVPHRWDDES